ncbi:DUF928 domain-containing protein [Leptolyngbya sp. AN03gr2]|uniref:DUF928 domain-containing protein n=1 Tax=unclassified Leptolyngbya TaxID=2650499 RepID=UPI003D32234A
MTPLAPLSHVGRTISLRPTFIWFVPDRQPYLLQFRLFRNNGQLLYRTQMRSQSGLMQFSLPKEQPELEVGQSYVWQVALICDPNTPSLNVVATAKVEIVQLTAALRSQLETVQNPQQRSERYAESGLWYDAIAEARKSSRPAVLNLLNSLASSEARSQKSWSDRLKQIEAAITVSAN